MKREIPLIKPEQEDQTLKETLREYLELKNLARASLINIPPAQFTDHQKNLVRFLKRSADE